MNKLRSALTPMRAWLLVVLLLAAQAAGLSHRVSHLQQPGRFTTAVTLALAQQAAGAPQAAVGGEHQSGSADCRLIDQLMHADALCVGAVMLAALPQPFESAVGPQAVAPWAAAAALYLARAPPLG